MQGEEEKLNNREAACEPAEEAPAGGVEPAEAAGEGLEKAPEAAELEKLKAELAAKEAELRELKEKLLRAYADLDNFRKRWRREQEELTKFANEKLISALLPVLDGLEQALKASEEKGTPLYKGVEMIFRQLEEVLRREGLVPVNPAGEPFDPYYHEALMAVETADHPPQTVVEVLRRGYVLNGRVLRPALVKVSQRKVIPFRTEGETPEKEGEKDAEGNRD